MRIKQAVALSLTMCVVMTWAPLFGHHGRAGTYAGAEPVTTEATVVRFDYKNPHVRIYFETRDDDGNVTHWSGEMANISQFVRAGWTKVRMEEQLQPGEVLTFTYLPSTVAYESGDTRDSIVMRMINKEGEVVGLVRGNLAEALAP
jgi:hypothetical protein